VDVGSKRVGLAISDALGITAQGLPTLEIKEGEDIFSRITEIVKEKNAGEIVVGLPLNMNGSEGPQAKNAILFADKLKAALEIPVKLWDERLSTMEAERVMIGGGASRQTRKKKIDKLAAQLILQSYLNAGKRNV